MDFLKMIFGASIPGVSAAELNDMVKSGKKLTILDVRQPDEYRLGHISGAKLVPLPELRARVTEFGKNSLIVCVCASGSRSTSAAKILSAAGYEVINLRGGMSAWGYEKFPTKKGMQA